MRSIRTLAFTGAIVFLAAGAAFAAKSQPAQQLTVPDGDLTVTVKMDEFQICAGASHVDISEPSRMGCYFWVGSSAKKDDRALLVTIGSEGKWDAAAESENFSAKHKDEYKRTYACELHDADTKAAAEEEKKDEEKKDEAEEEKKDGAEEEKKDEAWKDLPVLTVDERRAGLFSGSVRVGFCDTKAEGELEGEGNERTLTLAADILPEGEYYIYSSGWFGAYVAGTADDEATSLQIGSSQMYGPLKLSRN